MSDFNPDNPNNYSMQGGVPLHVHHEQQSQAHQADLIAQGKSVSPGGDTPRAPARASTFFRNVLIWAVALFLFHTFESNRWIPGVAILVAVILTIPAFRGCALVMLALVAVTFGIVTRYAPLVSHLPSTRPAVAHHVKPSKSHHHPPPVRHSHT